MRHRFGALPVRTSALVALSVLGLLLAGRLISGPSTVRARPPARTLALPNLTGLTRIDD
jgi:hypothetical protein